jgi:hypothetical protein
VLRVDMITALVPATWEVAGARPVPTTPNKGFIEGRLEPAPADIDELVSAGLKVPGALFEAEGANGVGGRIGVVVGVYDTGGEDPVSAVQQSVAGLTPAASVQPTLVSSKKGVRTLLRLDDESVEGGSVICDYWAPFGKVPSHFVLLRFWRTGAASADEEELFDNVVGSFLAGGGPLFSGAARLAIGRKLMPPDPSEVAEPGRFRYAGWRLGTVFHSKMLPAKEAAFATEGGARPKDALLLNAVFFAWLVATLVLVGVGPILIVGGLTTLGALKQLRSRGSKAVMMLAVVLGGLLVFGVATE